MSMDQPPKDPPSSGLYLTGFHLHNAGWDTNKQEVCILQHGRPTPVPLPLIWLRPMDTLSLQKLKLHQEVMYSCPVYMSADTSHVNDGNIVIFLRLRTALEHYTMKMRNVFITADM